MECNSDKPLFSIIIPTYNHAHCINRCLDSVVNQTYPYWEAIVVNNFSEDNTIEVVKLYNDQRIRLINFNNNGIIAASRNTGIREAKGDWIAFLDSDDWWALDKLQVCFERINDQVDIIYHDLKIVRETTVFFRQKKIKSWQLKKPVLMDLLVNGNPIANSSVVLRKKLLDQIGGIDENLKMIACEDFHTWLRIAQITDAFSYIPKCIGYYGLSSLGISRKDMSLPVKFVLVNYMHLLNRDEINKIRSRLDYTEGRFAFLSKNYGVARKNLCFSLRYGDYAIQVKSMLMLLVIAQRNCCK